MPSIRTAVTTSLVLAAGALAWVASRARSTLERLRKLLRTAAALTRSAAARAVAWVRGVATGPARDLAAGPVRTALLGRRADVSLLVALTAPVLAAAAAWWVLTAVGGPGTLGNWVTGTWSGTDPSVALAVAVTLVVAAGATSAAVNSGLLPTTVLVAGPVFGALLTRYGTESPRLVSLPDAVVFAAGVAVVGGGLLGVLSFVVGAGVRRVVRVLVGGSGPTGRPEGT
jgi:hypothetical protein